MSGVYPGYLMPQMPQTLMPQMSHQALFMQQSLCMQQMQQQPLLQQMQQSVFPPTAQNYPSYLANPPTGPGGEVDEVGILLLSAPVWWSLARQVVVIPADKDSSLQKRFPK